MIESIASMTVQRPKYSMKNLTLMEQIQNCIELLITDRDVKFMFIMDDKVTSNCSPVEQIEMLRKQLIKVIK
jgi:hypothetical protein